MIIGQPLAEVHLWLWSYRRYELPGYTMICLAVSVAALLGLFGSYRTGQAAGSRFRKLRLHAGWWLASALGFLGVMTFSNEFRPGGVLLALDVAAVLGLLGHRRARRAAVSRRRRVRLPAQGWLGSTLGFFGVMTFACPWQPPWAWLGLAVSAAGLYALLGGDRHCRTAVAWVRRQRRPTLSPSFWCLACFLVSNALMSVLMSGHLGWEIERYSLPAWMGMIGGQAAVHSIWCVFAPHPWVRRFLAGALAASAAFVGFVIPPVLFDVLLGRHWHLAVGRELAVSLLCLPLFLLAAQTPLWIMRFWFRWRIVRRDAEAADHVEPLRIGGLLVATTIVSIALGAARVSQSLLGRSGSSNMVGLVFSALVIVVISAMTVLPAVLACLRARRLPRALGLALVAIAAVPAGFVFLGVNLFGQRVPWQIVFPLSALAGFYFVYLTAPLLLARRRGCRLLCRLD